MNNIREFTGHETIREEARKWLIRLDNNTPLADKEIEALREWLGRSQAHRRELRRISRFWDNANILAELAIPLTKPGRSGKKTLFGHRSTKYARYGLATLAATVLLAVCITLFNLVPSETGPTGGNVYGTAIGQLRTVTLPDGSTAQLNTDSLIEVDYTDMVRKIRLLRGESRFEVVHNPGKPFEVYAGSNMVRAVGTAFSVQLLSRDVKVTVEEGKVELITVEEKKRTDIAKSASPPELKLLGSLQRGQCATFNDRVDSISNLSKDELARQTSWQRGVLSFSGEPLSEVVKQINRYTPKTIEIADPELKTLPVGGRFKIADLDEIFEVLKTSFGIQVSRVDNQHILLRSGRRK